MKIFPADIEPLRYGQYDDKNKHVVYRGEDCMKKFFKYLGKHTTKTINFEMKKMILLTNEEQESWKG